MSKYYSIAISHLEFQYHNSSSQIQLGQNSLHMKNGKL